MPVPWLRVFDFALRMFDLLWRRGRRLAAADSESLVEGQTGGLEKRVAGVMIAAVREAFDRDSRRLAIEREQVEAERRRADRLLRLELLRQAADREAGRLRMLAGVAVASWIGTLLLTGGRVLNGGPGIRVTVGFGWTLLLAGLAATFVAQSCLAAEIGRACEAREPTEHVSSGPAGAVALWLVVAGLAVVGLAALAS